MLAEVFKILGSTENLTWNAEFKVNSANHFTIQPIGCITKITFESTRAEPNGEAFNFLNQSAILSKRA